jgi:polysaccharide export outer membrane protein
MRSIHLLIAIGSFFFISCTAQRRAPNNYLQSNIDTSGDNAYVFPDIIIQKGDVLSIQIYSAATRPEADQLYNLPANSTSAATSGFLVDVNGNIQYPRLGTIKAEGLTKTQLADNIKQKLEGQLVQPSVVIRFANYRVTILGEVNTPGSFIVPTERITILEALGLAGDITEFGKRETVKVVRETNGKRQIGTVDLTSGNMFASPYYNLQQNDVVVIEATREKSKQREQQTVAQQIGFLTSGLAAVALILNLIK